MRCSSLLLWVGEALRPMIITRSRQPDHTAGPPHRAQPLFGDIVDGSLLTNKKNTHIQTCPGLGGQANADQLAYAAMQQKTLLTHNRVHFESLAKLYFEQNKTHWGDNYCCPSFIVRNGAKALEYLKSGYSR